jgi:hypothetical protein
MCDVNGFIFSVFYYNINASYLFHVLGLYPLNRQPGTHMELQSRRVESSSVHRSSILELETASLYRLNEKASCSYL